MSKRPGCCYCEENKELQSFATKICELEASVLYLYRDQRHYGRCCVACKEHVDELFELGRTQLNALAQDVANVAWVVKEITNCNKINYAIYGDIESHLHVHIVPKTVHGPDWGNAFQTKDGEGYLTETEERQLIEKIQKLLFRGEI